MKLLVILSRIPYPLEKGDRLRAFHQIRNLSRHFEIHLCCLNDEKEDPGAKEVLAGFCRSITFIKLNKASVYWNVLKSFFTGEPLQVGYFYSCKAKKILHRLIDEIKPDHIYCQLLRVAKYVENIDLPKTLDYQDVFSKGYERQAKMAGFFVKPVFKMEACRLRRYEHKIFDWFDHHTIISDSDKQQIDHQRRDDIAIVHNGVDLDFFKPAVHEKDVDILFTGNMNYPPNVTGVEFLVNKILPVMNHDHQPLRVMIAGVNPSNRVLSLRSSQVEVTGRLDDIRTAYARAKMFIAPMQIGTGMQNKLLEAMAMKIPCITSSLANSALGAEPGKEILVCDTPQEYAEAAEMIMFNEQKASAIAQNGHDFVRHNYQWETETEKLGAIIKGH